MADIIIRGVDEALVQALDERAAAAGMRREAWLREQLVALASGAIVRRTYALRAFDNQPERASTLQFARYPDGSVEITKWHALTPAQRDIMFPVKGLMERNEPGDREAAMRMLQEHFEQVFETRV